ncbi:MAG: hypothetical protein C5S40_00170 [ANME-2 cluster archaeon]|nr:hypothetical protein [ANME-2 cluster archaeon]
MHIRYNNRLAIKAQFTLVQVRINILILICKMQVFPAHRHHRCPSPLSSQYPPDQQGILCIRVNEQGYPVRILNIIECNTHTNSRMAFRWNIRIHAHSGINHNPQPVSNIIKSQGFLICRIPDTKHSNAGTRTRTRSHTLKYIRSSFYRRLNTNILPFHHTGRIRIMVWQFHPEPAQLTQIRRTALHKINSKLTILTLPDIKTTAHITSRAHSLVNILFHCNITSKNGGVSSIFIPGW